MQNCSEFVEKIYNHPQVNSLIGKVKPTHLQDDLKQEMALALLNYPCDKLTDLNRQDNLLRFAYGVIWRMALGKKGNFHKTYRDTRICELPETVTDEPDDMPDNPLLDIIDTEVYRMLGEKMQTDANGKHECMLFETYLEMRNVQKVAKHYGVPRLHVRAVVNKVRNELKEKLLKCI